VADAFAQDDWHWSIRQAEYSTDLKFRSRDIPVPLYDAISRQAVLAAVHAYRGSLLQALNGRGRRQGRRQILARAAHGDHRQRRQLFLGATAGWNTRALRPRASARR
jgi:hypothetical protein